MPSAVNRPGKPQPPSETALGRDSRVVLAVLASVLTIEALLLAFVHHPARRREALQATRARLKLIATDRRRAVGAWVKERTGDVRLAGHAWSEFPDRAAGTALLEHVVDVYDYDSAWVVDKAGRTLAQTRVGDPSAPCIATFSRQARGRPGVLIDFCRDANGRPRVVTAKADPTSGTVVVLVADPSLYVYPLLDTWAIATRTGETTLARVEGRWGVALTPLRYSDAPPLTVRRPLEQSAFGARSAAQDSIFRYRDYRGLPVVAAMYPIEGTPWWLVMKIDESEVWAGARSETRRLGLLLLFSTILLGGAALAFLRSRRFAELRAADEQYRLLFENSINGFTIHEVIFDAEGKPCDHRLIAANPAADRMEGIEPLSQKIGMTSEQLQVKFPPEITERFYRVAMTGERLLYERLNESVNRWFSAQIFSPRHGQFAIVFNDITERKLQEESLRALSDNSRLGVFGHQDGVFNYVNSAAADIFGHTHDEALGADVLSFVDERDREFVAEMMSRRLAGEPVPPFYDFHGVRRDGAVRRIRLYASRVELRGRAAIVGNLLDVTEAWEADRESRRLHLAISQLAEAIVVVGTEGTIEYVNPAFERMHGVSHQEVLGHNWSLFVTDLNEPSAYSTLERTIRSGGTWQGFLKHRRPDGTTFEEEATISPVRDAGGRVMNYVAIKRDLTRERNLLAQLYQAQKMEAIGTLAGGVAHDFNNILQGMMLLVQAARKRNDVPEKVRTALAELERLTQRGAGLTRQLLLFSRKEVARLELLDLGAVVNDASKLLQRLVRENIHLSVDVAEEILTVRADRGQLEQALMNLVVNARDAMPDGGTLRIVAAADGPDHCSLVVEDSGHGIPEEIRERIFEPFFTTKGKDKGTGLGLSVVHGIVTEHQGNVIVEDRPSGGTRFVLSFPRARAEVALETPPQAEPVLPRGDGRRVLVIEDEEAVRTGLVAMLELLGYASTAVRTGEDALALDHPPPDVILADVVLPGISGPETGRRLAARWPGVRIILMSGYTGEAGGGIQREFPDHLQKPFAIDSLAAALAHATGGRTRR